MGLDHSRRQKNVLTLLCDLIFLRLSILVRFTLAHISEQVFDRDSFIVGAGVCAEHLHLVPFFIHIEMLLVNGMQLVPEHVEVIQVQIRDLKLTLSWS